MMLSPRYRDALRRVNELKKMYDDAERDAHQIWLEEQA